MITGVDKMVTLVAVEVNWRVGVNVIDGDGVRVAVADARNGRVFMIWWMSASVGVGVLVEVSD